MGSCKLHKVDGNWWKAPNQPLSTSHMCTHTMTNTHTHTRLSNSVFCNKATIFMADAQRSETIQKRAGLLVWRCKLILSKILLSIEWDIQLSVWDAKCDLKYFPGEMKDKLLQVHSWKKYHHQQTLTVPKYLLYPKHVSNQNIYSSVSYLASISA